MSPEKIKELREKFLNETTHGSSRLVYFQWIVDNVIKAKEEDIKDAYEPYFGWCDVDGCENEGCSGGMAWRNTGYWTVCYKHSDMHRKGNPQPEMNKKSIEREKTRGADGTLL